MPSNAPLRSLLRISSSSSAPSPCIRFPRSQPRASPTRDLPLLRPLSSSPPTSISSSTSLSKPSDITSRPLTPPPTPSSPPPNPNIHRTKSFPPPPIPSSTTAFPRLRRWLGIFSKPNKDEQIQEQIRLAKHRFREAISLYATKEARTEDQELSCVIFDESGNGRHAVYKKTILCDQFELDIRDIRRIDPTKLNRIPTVVIKNDAIILTVLHIRAIIKHNAVILFDPAGMTETTLQKAMIGHLKASLASDQVYMPYEFRAIESLFTSSCRALDAELRYVSVMVDKVLADLETDVSKDALRTLLSHTRRLTDFYDRANGVMTVLDDLLEDDGDMVALYLTDKFSTKKPNPNRIMSGDHTEVELLLERLQKQVEEIVGEVGRMVENMRTTQDVVDLILDASRNRLLEMDLKVSMATLSVGTAALVAGFFGMNLQSHLESHPFAFYYTFIGALVMAGFVMRFQTNRLHAVLRKPLHESGNLVDTQYRWLDQGQPFQYQPAVGATGGKTAGGGAGGAGGVAARRIIRSGGGAGGSAKGPVATGPGALPRHGHLHGGARR